MKLLSFSVGFLLTAVMSLVMAEKPGNLRAADPAKNLPEKSFLADPPLTTPASHPEPKRRLMTMNCVLQSGFQFTVKFQVTTYYSAQCSAGNLNAVRNLLQNKFDSYVAYNSVLGPIDLQRSAPFCPPNSRRRQLHQHVMTNNETETTTTRIQGESPHLAAQDERELFFLPLLITRFNPAVFTGLGPCRFCNPDNRDYRKLQTSSSSFTITTTMSGTGSSQYTVKSGTTVINGQSVSTGTTTGGTDFPITLRIGTDGAPHEISWKLEALDGSLNTAQGGYFQAYAAHDKVIVLKAGKQYKLTLYDSYGDGWCCSRGYGYVQLYKGTVASGSPWMTVDANFGAAKSMIFTAGDATSHNTADEILRSLEGSMSEYMTYYVQQQFFYDWNHCFYWKYPSVSVDLSPDINSQAESSC